jgi:hypothetical protein
MLPIEPIARHVVPGRSILVATVSPDGFPACCRGVGVRADPALTAVTVYVPVATGAQAVANLSTNGRIAVASSEPASHETVQLKGRVREVRVARDDEEAWVRGCVERLAGVLDRVGLPRGVTRSMTCWPAFALEVEVEAVFDQTPGPRAGAPMGSR